MIATPRPHPETRALARACRGFVVIGILFLSACSTVVTTERGGDGGPATHPPAAPAVPEPVPTCRECGVVQRIDTIPAGRTVSSAKGPVLGGIVGGVASRDIAKDASGTGGAGQTAPARDTYNIHVRLQDGRDIVINQAELGGLRAQMRVRVVGGRVVPQ